MRRAWKGKKWIRKILKGQQSRRWRERQTDKQTERGGGKAEKEEELNNVMGYHPLSQTYSSIQPSFANKDSVVFAIFPDLTDLRSWQWLTGCLQRGKCCPSSINDIQWPGESTAHNYSSQ